jgi:hypothetical protein
MANSKFVKARKPQGKCRRGGCETIINRGDEYYSVAYLTGPRSSVKKAFCKEHPPRPSETTGNERLSQLYAAQEALEDAINKATTLEDLTVALEEAKDQANEVAESYRESVQNMPENLQNGSGAQDLEDKAQNCDDWAEKLESTKDDIERTDGEDPDEDAECGNCQHPYSEHKAGKECSHKEEGETDCDCTEFTTPEDVLEDARTSAADACGELSL